MVDFRQLTSKPMDKIKKPQTLPPGTYKGVIAGQEYGESSKKKTPYCRFAIRLTSAGDDVAPERLTVEGQPLDIGKKNFNTDFYLTPDAEYRLVEFLSSCGVDVSNGRSLAEGIPDAMNAIVIVNLAEDMKQDGSGDFFNQIKEVKGEAGEG